MTLLHFIRESTGVRLTRSGEELLIEFNGILSRLDYLLMRNITSFQKRPLGLSVSAQHHICGMASFISVINKLNESYGSFHHCGFMNAVPQKTYWIAWNARDWTISGIIFFHRAWQKGQMIQNG